MTHFRLARFGQGVHRGYRGRPCGVLNERRRLAFSLTPNAAASGRAHLQQRSAERGPRGAQRVWARKGVSHTPLSIDDGRPLRGRPLSRYRRRLLEMAAVLVSSGTAHLAASRVGESRRLHGQPRPRP